MSHCEADAENLKTASALVVDIINRIVAVPNNFITCVHVVVVLELITLARGN